MLIWLKKPNHIILYPTNEEDINEHWDVSVNNIKIDIKGLRKIKRNDHEVNDTIHWIELENVLGKPGWLYGKADYIAFELLDSWLLVKRYKLIELINNKLKIEISNTPEIYKMYRRFGRYDTITLVPTSDLKIISTKIIKK